MENIALSMHISKSNTKNKRKAAYALLEKVGILHIFQTIAHEQGKCVILVTHSPKVASHCDHVHLLEGGRFKPANA